MGRRYVDASQIRPEASRVETVFVHSMRDQLQAVRFEDLARALDLVRSKLDHHFLNDLPGLNTPSLENLARWIAEKLHAEFPQLANVTGLRPSLGESCTYNVA